MTFSSDVRPINRSTTHSQNYRPDIDGLRAVAVLLVVLFHAFPEIGGAGFIGVDVFFVISGYLITQNLLQTPSDLPAFRVIVDFYSRRVRRIFPALAVVLAIAFLYGWLFFLPDRFHSLKKFVVSGGAFTTNFVLWREAGYFDQAIELKPLMHLWSLAIEEQFYIVWPLIVVVLSRRHRNWMTYIIALLLIASFACCLFLTFSNPTAAYYSPISRGWELAAGALLATWSSRQSNLVRNILAASGFCAILIAAVSINRFTFPGWQAAVPVAGTCLLILFGKDTVTDQRLLRLSVFRYLGLISYPLYLWHWLLLSFLRIEFYNTTVLMRIATIAIAIVLSAATYHLIETPLRRVRLRLALFTSASAMATVLIIAAGSFVMKLGGAPATPFQIALASPNDARPAYRYSKCFLDTTFQTGNDFAQECLPSRSLKPVFLLWGDSLAAQFYPGLAKSEFGQNFLIAQTTATACPPAESDRYPDRINCDSMNAAARKYIAATRPEYVLLNGRWFSVHGQQGDQIGAIVSFLKRHGVQNVILAGPAPDWVPDIRTLLSARRFSAGYLPSTLEPPHDAWSATTKLETSLRATAANHCLSYLSLVDHFCRGQQCRITVSTNVPEGLVTTDHDHLTAESSIDLFSRFEVDRLRVPQQCVRKYPNAPPSPMSR